MSYTEMKRFHFPQPPTGNQLVDLVQGNKLHHWKVDIQRVHNDGLHSMWVVGSGSQWRYEVTFSRMVQE